MVLWGKSRSAIMWIKTRGSEVKWAEGSAALSPPYPWIHLFKAAFSPPVKSRLPTPALNSQACVGPSLRTRISLIISGRSNCQAGHLCLNTFFPFRPTSFFFFFYLFHTHISHHKGRTRQGRQGQASSLWTINTRTDRLPAWPAYILRCTAQLRA